ncbi:MAG: GNAT family N-acetyltransferase [Firmicutes bacterium]|nr:GNAT family N-acetyltransferase [Bacillota bacterium]
MCEIALQIPTARHTMAAEIYRKDFLHHGEYMEENINPAWPQAYNNWLGNSYRNSIETTASKDWVPTTTFFAVRKEDNKIIGNTTIRHNLEQDILREYGGHIGYAVCPSERSKGYGTTILELALEQSHGLGLDRVMLSCKKNNIASRRIIEKCGGVFEREIQKDDQNILIYWISI